MGEDSRQYGKMSRSFFPRESVCLSGAQLLTQFQKKSESSVNQVKDRDVNE